MKKPQNKVASHERPRGIGEKQFGLPNLRSI